MFTIKALLEATHGTLVKGAPDERVGGVSIDTRTLKPGDVFITIRGTRFDGNDFIGEALKKGAACVIRNTLRKKTPRTHAGHGSRSGAAVIEVKDTVRALNDIAHFHRMRFNIPVVAVTGSNGKTTTKEMLALVLSKRYAVLKNEGTKNNQIGVPLTLLNLSPKHTVAVVELGTNHDGEIASLSKTVSPTLAVITNIGPSHLEHFKTLEGVFREKYSLLEHLALPAVALLNSDDEFLKKAFLRQTKQPFCIGFGMRRGTDFNADHVAQGPFTVHFRVNKSPVSFSLPTMGCHNIYNALAAIAVGRLFGVGYKEMAASLAHFKFPQGRLQVTKINETPCIDDTYNSNPLSLEQALQALRNVMVRGRKIFVMGDMKELGDDKEFFHSQAGRKAADICDTFITVGSLAKRAADAAAAAVSHPAGAPSAHAKKARFDAKNIFVCDTCLEASRILTHTLSLTKEDIVLVKGSRSMKMEEIFKI